MTTLQEFIIRNIYTVFYDKKEFDKISVEYAHIYGSDLMIDYMDHKAKLDDLISNNN